MPNFTYLPGPEDPETVQPLGYSFTAGEWTPVPDDHATAVAKLRGNCFFAEQEGDGGGPGISAGERRAPRFLKPISPLPTAQSYRLGGAYKALAANGKLAHFAHFGRPFARLFLALAKSLFARSAANNKAPPRSQYAPDFETQPSSAARNVAADTSAS
jgi:hypothetical protein